MPLDFREQVPLAPLTTLELGGPARYFVSVASEDEVQEALAWAVDGHHPVLLLGGGSNIVIGDVGFDGLVIHLSGLRGVRFHNCGSSVEVTAAAGEPWDDLVARAVDRDLAGLECLSGIPGFVGGAPIQNIGAYGQEVSETIVRVRAFDRKSACIVDLTSDDCAFSYRESAFKREPDRHVVLSVTFRLEAGGTPALRYGELQRALAAESGDAAPSLRQVRDQVIALRRAKSMVLDPQDPPDDNRRSAGSFFTNPIVPDAEADRVVSLAVAEGIVQEPREVPRYPAGPGFTKLAAGWLIERAGIAKGTRRGNVGISTRHALGLVHHGGARTEDLLALAREVRSAVEDRFGVTLVPEPRLVNCAL